jgi:DNA-binding XRE family transcriptional regulator
MPSSERILKTSNFLALFFAKCCLPGPSLLQLGKALDRPLDSSSLLDVLIAELANRGASIHRPFEASELWPRPDIDPITLQVRCAPLVVMDAYECLRYRFIVHGSTIDPRFAFGSTVRRLREQRGLSQEELAKLAGIHRTYVGDVERGTRNIALVNMTRLAKALRVSLSHLIHEMEKVS